MQLSPYYIDVRDVALAHVKALSLPPSSSPSEYEKRFLISGGVFSWKEAAAYLAEARPERKERLPSLEGGVGSLPGTVSTIDVALAKERLWLETYVAWKTTVSDTVDSFLKLEKTWA